MLLVHNDLELNEKHLLAKLNIYTITLLEISHTVNIQNFDNRNRGDLLYKNIFSSPG